MNKPCFSVFTFLILSWFAEQALFAQSSIVFPSHPNVIDVTRAPYSAKGDGVTDDTQAIQAAINDHVGQHHVLYFPRGTYLVSATLRWPKRFAEHDNWGFTYLCGQSAKDTVIKLKAATFTDPQNPQAIMWCGGFGSADWFHNYIENLTFDVGQQNPGATALQFYSNNSGAIRNCRFIAEPDSGHVGLDLSHRDMNGPLLVRYCEVIGFKRGITTANAVNGQVFEHIRLKNQREVGMSNEGQCISIRRLVSENSVPALSIYGTTCLIEAKLTGIGDASAHPAIINYNGGRLFVRQLQTQGYRRAIGDVSHTPDSGAAYRLTETDRPPTVGPTVDEYSSHPVFSAFESPAQSMRLLIKEPPVIPQRDLSQWATVDAFGADPSGERDSSNRSSSGYRLRSDDDLFAGQVSTCEDR